MRIHELAKKYSVTNDELIALLQNAGYEVNTHMSSVDYDMLEALERHFNWSTPAKKKAKAKKKTKSTTKAEVVVQTKVKVKARLKTKAKLQKREEPAEEKTKKEEKTTVKTKAKLTAKAKAGAAAEEKTKAEKKSETKAKATTKTKSKTKAKKAVQATPETDTAAKETKAEKAVKDRPKAETAKGSPRAAEPAKEATKVKEAEKSAKPATQVKPGGPAKAEKKIHADAASGEKKRAKETKRPKAERKAKGAKRTAEKHIEPSKPRARKTPAEIDAQRKAVRESVRRTLAKLETTRKTKRRKSKTAGEIATDLQPVQIQDKSTVAMLADVLEIPVEEIVRCCEEMGVAATPTQELDRDIIELVAEAVGRTVKIEAVYGETRLREEAAVDPSKLRPRAPIVTVMGHVDHGKTSILDYIRKTNVVGGEAGGITQHVGAYEVDAGSGKITFIDTPGHEAFTAMRARGAQLTDIVVLVVAADDGVMPQTVEAINHTKAAGVTMVVAINKSDLASANPANVRQQLAQAGVVVEGYSGDVVEAEVSAKTGQGIDKLLEMILLQAELLELKADPTTRAQGVVVESKKEEGRGIMCTVLIQQGTLGIGDVFVVGNEYGKVRSLLDHRGKRVKEAGPSSPVQVLGFNGVPEAGDSFIAVKDEREAREVSDKRRQAMRTRDLLPEKTLTLEDLYAQIQQGEIKELDIVIKGDTDGSVEALRDCLTPISFDEVKVKVLHSGVGVVSEWDVLLAANSDALVLAFNTNVAPKAKTLAKLKGVEVRNYDVIYEAVEDIENAMKGMLEPEIVERVLGKAEVRKVFRVSKMGLVAGSMVVEGVIERNASARVFRGEELMFEGKVVSLKRFQDDVKEVAENFECGIGLSGFDTLQEGDVIEAFVVEERARVV
jgi:translation initiation factor IF-2